MKQVIDIKNLPQKKKVPLTGGIFLFLSFLFFINDQILSFIFFSFLILLLGLFSDLKHIKSAFQVDLLFKFHLYYHLLFLMIFN